LRPALQVKSHRPLVQVAVPPEGVAQGVQLAPQEAGEVSLLHDACWPCPQLWNPGAQTKRQLPLWQVAVALAGGAGHGVQELPHDSTLLLLLQVSPQRWWPSLQRKSHLPPSQVALALAAAGHGLHEAPHELTLLLLLHSEPHRWKPLRQAKRQLAPSQVATALLGGLQGVQALPHELRSVLDTQLPPQLCVPAVVHVPVQGEVAGVHFPAHSWVPAGHSPPHLLPSHVALPPSGAGQGVHEAPQLAGSSLLRQASPQRW
jgi:hypothetical protein